MRPRRDRILLETCIILFGPCVRIEGIEDVYIPRWKIAFESTLKYGFYVTPAGEFAKFIYTEVI